MRELGELLRKNGEQLTGDNLLMQEGALEKEMGRAKTGIITATSDL